MGYYTQYELEVKDLETMTDDGCGIIEKFRESCDYAKLALNESGNTEESCKWYDHDDDLINLSKEHPDKLFILSGLGEDSGDIWRKYFVNGKIQEEKAEIKIADFDINKLK